MSYLYTRGPSGSNTRVTGVQSLRGAEAVLLLFTTTLSCFRTQREFTSEVPLCQTKVVLLLPPQSYSFAVNRRLSQLNHAPTSISVEARQTLAEQVRQICQCINFCCRTSEILMLFPMRRTVQILKHLGLDRPSDPRNRSLPKDLTDPRKTLF